MTGSRPTADQPTPRCRDCKIHPATMPTYALCNECYKIRWRVWQARLPCTIDDCDRGQWAGGLCNPHYKIRWRATSARSDRPKQQGNDQR